MVDLLLIQFSVKNYFLIKLIELVVAKENIGGRDTFRHIKKQIKFGSLIK
jgi:hypothetical protein